MTNRQTTYRAMHDVGLAAWFGGSLFGAAGLNAAAAEAPDRRTGERVASIGWAKWTPVNAVAVAAHAIGGLGLLLGNQRRLQTQPGVRANTTIKTGLTLAAAGATVWARLLGKKVEQNAVHRTSAVSSSATSPLTSTGGGPGTVAGAVDREVGKAAGEAAERLPIDVDQAERQLRVAQFAVPVLTGAALIMAAQAGEQQRPSEQFREAARRVVGV